MMLSKYAQITGLTIAVFTLLGALWAAADYTNVRPVLKHELIGFIETQKQLSENVLLLRFQVLMQKSEQGKLTFAEHQELCSIVRQLQFVGIKECINR